METNEERLAHARAKKAKAHEDMRDAVRRLSEADAEIRRLSPLTTMIRPTDTDYEREYLDSLR